MTRFHLRFRDFKVETLEETEKLFAEKPWRLDLVDRLVLAQRWADKLCEVYEVPKVRVEVGRRLLRRQRSLVPSTRDPLAYASSESNEDVPANDMGSRPELRIPKWSLLLLFKAFRRHMLENGYESVSLHEEDDVHGWACSLFYTVRPKMFRARVREGRIGRVSPDDLLKTETLRRRAEEEARIGEERARVEMQSEETSGFEDIDVSAANDRIAVHNENAGEDVSQMNTRPLRRYATSVGLEGAWNLSKGDILTALRNLDGLADAARSHLTSVRSELGTRSVL